MDRENWLGQPIPAMDDFQPDHEIKVDPKWPPDIMTIDDYMDSVDHGMFIDYDGHGHPAVERDGKFYEDRRHEIIPSLGRDCFPEGATHVNWFNK